MDAGRRRADPDDEAQAPPDRRQVRGRDRSALHRLSGPVFITGALGFIGRALGDRLRSRGTEVRGVDVRADDDLGVVAGDIAEQGDWQAAARGCALVVHTAAVVSNAVGAGEQWRVNVLGTRRVAQAARGARLVHLSSVRAFSDRGFPDGVAEDHPVRPDGSPYVDTKIAAEQVVLQAHAAGELEAVVIRPGDVYGPGSRPWTILPVELIRRRRFVLPAMGRGVHSPVYVDDLLDGLELAMTAPAATGQVLTLTGGAGVSTREFFGHYFRMLGRRGPVCLPTPVAVALAAVNAGLDRGTEANPESMRLFTRTGTYSIAKARRVLGYEPRVGLAEGMARTETWLRETGRL